MESDISIQNYCSIRVKMFGNGSAINSDREKEEQETCNIVPNSNDEVIICVDTSASTEDSHEYYNYVNDIVYRVKLTYENVSLISWNREAKYTLIEETESDSYTRRVSFLKLLKDINSKYHLVLITDGELYDREVNASRKILKDSNILSNIISIEVFFVGSIFSMNLHLSDLFNGVKNKKIIINDQRPIEIMDIAVKNLTYDDFIHNDNVVGSLLELIKLQPDKEDEIRQELDHLNIRIRADIGGKTTISQYYKKGDVSGCVDFVKKIDPWDKIKFRRVMRKLLEFFSDNRYLYSVSHLINIGGSCETYHDNSDYDDEVDGEDNNDSDDSDDAEGKYDNQDDNNCEDNYYNHDEDSFTSSLNCDLNLIKSTSSCTEIIRLQACKFSVLSNEDSKLVSQYPWLVLNNEEIINRIIQHVGCYIYDLKSRNRLNEACSFYSSAYREQKIGGVFVFHCGSSEDNYDLVYKNNNRVLSLVFNSHYKFKLRKCIFYVIFLYILGKYHPYWKQHSNIIRKELYYILPKLRSFITLSPFLNPPVIDQLDVSFWFVMNVAHRAFPNSSQNILRFAEEPRRLIDLYEYIYPNHDTSDIKFKVNVWNYWKYLISNQSSKMLKLEVVSQYQNHEILDGNIILFSGKSDKQSIDLKPLHVKNLYDYMLTKPEPSLFEIIPFDKLDTGDVTPVEVTEDQVGQLHSFKICLITCQPHSYFIPNVIWKDSDEGILKKESFFLEFVSFCEKNGKYPDSAEEFLIYHSNKHNFSNCDNNCIVYGKDIKRCFKAVMSSFSSVMEVYSPEDFVLTYYQYCDNSIAVKHKGNRLCTVYWVDLDAVLLCLLVVFLLTLADNFQFLS